MTIAVEDTVEKSKAAINEAIKGHDPAAALIAVADILGRLVALESFDDDHLSEKVFEAKCHIEKVAMKTFYFTEF